ncbi:hypothetical protein TRVA0_075S00122 [Trichomonascus vanleenenianus]|uniref:flavin-containing monooxygenase n=1 Tax=Trichomonascus vanleenenianus TaxID=2268995 RepID=UPI003ECAA600
MAERHSTAVIVGAGFSGLASAITLKDHFKTTDFVIFEKHNGVGGTWYANRYPGCSSDVPAPWYSLSTDLNPDWTEATPPYDEMQHYLEGVVENHGLEDNIKFQHSVLGLDWDDDKKIWRSRIKNDATGEIYEHTSKLAFLCQGFLVYPNEFNIEGLKDKFQGEYMHSGYWRSEVDLKDKNIVVVGNGCSACQLVPEILDESKQIVQLIRSTHWLYPYFSRKLFAAYQRFWSRSILRMKIYRFLTFLFSELKAPYFNARNPFSGIAEWYFSRISMAHMRKNIPEKYHELLIPKFKFGCKRMVIDRKYTEALHSEKLSVIKEDIVRVSERHVHTSAGNSYPADVLIAANGYNLRKSMYNIPIKGIDKSRTVQEKWDDEGISAYETILIDGCPNMFMIAGPNSATGHSSVVLAIENAQSYIKKVAKPVIEGSAVTVCVKHEAYQNWKSTIQDALKNTVFSTPYGGCVSWYANEKGNSTTYPWSQLTFWWRMNRPKWGDLAIN